MRKSRHVTVWLVKEELGMVRQAGQGTIRKSAAGSGFARQAWRGMAWKRQDWIGRHGSARHSVVGQGRRGTEGQDVVGFGSVRQGRRG